MLVFSQAVNAEIAPYKTVWEAFMWFSPLVQ
jgi:hypothetical protein